MVSHQLSLGWMALEQVLCFARILFEIVELSSGTSWNRGFLLRFGKPPGTQSVDVFPGSSANGIEAGLRGEDKGETGRSGKGGIGEVWEKAFAVGGGARRKFTSGELGERGEQVDETDRVARDNMGGQAIWPTHDEGDSMSVFPDISFHPSEAT